MKKENLTNVHIVCMTKGGVGKSTFTSPLSTMLYLNNPEKKINIFEQYSPSSELFEDKILSLPPSSYHFISHIFADTVLVDTIAVSHVVSGAAHGQVQKRSGSGYPEPQ